MLAANDVVAPGLDEALLGLLPAEAGRLMQPHYGEPLPLGEPDGLPYSKGMMARALIVAGVSIELAYELATRLELDLAERGGRAVELDRFEETAAEVLGEAAGAVVISRLRRLAALRALDVPIVLLVGGATGTGKSTVATEAAHRLGITRVTSTDFIRQTIRAFFSRGRLPSVHRLELRGRHGHEATSTTGFLEQTRKVLVGVEAAIEPRAHRGLVDGDRGHPPRARARADRDRRRARRPRRPAGRDTRGCTGRTSRVRDAVTGGERAIDKYLDQLDGSALLQDSIVERAGRNGVPVIESSNLGRATGSLIDLVLRSAERLEQQP